MKSSARKNVINIEIGTLNMTSETFKNPECFHRKKSNGVMLTVTVPLSDFATFTVTLTGPLSDNLTTVLISFRTMNKLIDW